MIGGRAMLLAALVVALTPPAAGASPDAAAARTLAQLRLAETLGEAHGLRQLCAPDDPTWRARMRRMIEVEAPSAEQEAALVDSFNSGFLKARQAHARCDASVGDAEARTAARGRDQARALVRGGSAPPAMAPTAKPR